MESASSGPVSGSAPPDRTRPDPAPPGASYESSPSAFRVTVRSPGPQSWLVVPLGFLWLIIAVYAFVLGPRGADSPASNTLILGAFALLIGIPVGASAVCHRWGRLSVSCHGGEGRVFEHIWQMGSAQGFAWNALSGAREVEVRGRYLQGKAVELDLSAARSHRKLYLGRGLPAAERRFVVESLNAEVRAGRRSRPLGLDG
ncbi:MAG: hypothetical protein IT163_04635 [Bryobacterales bacterium]|nr:hypothetical protein [Bryobacterales bacterium]